MRLRKWMIGAGVAVTATLAATASYAAYECRFIGGVEQCRWVPDGGYYYEPGVNPYGYGYGYSDYDRYTRNPDHLPIGSRAWWDEMQSQNRAGSTN